jgi:putative ATPase
MLSNQPLAERMRPGKLEGFHGQPHLVGEGSVLRKIIESGNLPSFILWGPPGFGRQAVCAVLY